MNCHILLVTFPSQGCLNPSIQFAKRVVRMGVKVTMLISLSVQHRMTGAAPLPEGITVASFSDGYDEGFATGDPQRFMSEHGSRCSQAVAELIKSRESEGHPITLMVYAMLQTRAAEVAHHLHVPSAVLWVQPAAVFDIYYHYFNGHCDTIRKIANDPTSSAQLPGLPRLAGKDLPTFLVPSHPNPFDSIPLFKDQLDLLASQTNPRILINTLGEAEQEALGGIEKFKLIPIGPLVPFSDSTGYGADLFEKSNDSYVEWLNSKPRSSVIYLAFGSIATFRKEQMEEIARGLLECHRPFLWVMRAGKNGERPEDELSCGKELKRQGMLVAWSSQMEILSHPSVGCFVSHCGWSSSLESLVSGVPVVAFPQFTDQTTNAKIIQDVWKTGVRLRADGKGLVGGEELKRCIEMVMGDGEIGQEMRSNAVKWKHVAAEGVKDGGSLDTNLKAFLDQVRDESAIA